MGRDRGGGGGGEKFEALPWGGGNYSFQIVSGGDMKAFSCHVDPGAYI